MDFRLVRALAIVFIAFLPACASVDFDRTTPSSGTFRSSAWSLTVLSFEMPGPALTVARSNASDSGQPNLIIESQIEFPRLGWFDWVLDIVGIRYGRISGTWGYPPEDWPSEGRQPPGD